jgi:hypothetical protein
MKNIIFVCLVLLLLGCNGKSKNHIPENKLSGIEDPFYPKLKFKIESLIEKTIEKYRENPERLYSISFSVDSNECFVRISSDFFYWKEHIEGYTYVDSNLVVCYNISGICNKKLVNKEALIPFADSIAGFKDYSLIDMEYEMVTQVFKIINRDSLELIQDYP